MKEFAVTSADRLVQPAQALFRTVQNNPTPLIWCGVAAGFCASTGAAVTALLDPDHANFTPPQTLIDESAVAQYATKLQPGNRLRNQAVAKLAIEEEARQQTSLLPKAGPAMLVVAPAFDSPADPGDRSLSPWAFGAAAATCAMGSLLLSYRPARRQRRIPTLTPLTPPLAVPQLTAFVSPMLSAAGSALVSQPSGRPRPRPQLQPQPAPTQPKQGKPSPTKPGPTKPGPTKPSAKQRRADRLAQPNLLPLLQRVIAQPSRCLATVAALFQASPRKGRPQRPSAATSQAASLQRPKPITLQSETRPMGRAAQRSAQPVSQRPVRPLAPTQSSALSRRPAAVQQQMRPTAQATPQAMRPAHQSAALSQAIAGRAPARPAAPQARRTRRRPDILSTMELKHRQPIASTM